MLFCINAIYYNSPSFLDIRLSVFDYPNIVPCNFLQQWDYTGIFYNQFLAVIRLRFIKIITSVLFYVGVLMILILHSSPEHAFIFINYFLIGLGIVFIIILFDRYKINLAILKKYYSLFKKLLISSLTLVVSNFANVYVLVYGHHDLEINFKHTKC